MKAKIALTLFAALALVAPAGASAHVTLQPSEAPAGDYVVLDVRVPNERDDAATRKVDVQVPPGFVFASYQPVAGWSAKVTMEKIAKPLTSHGEQIDEQVSQVTWTATDSAAAIGPGQFQDFPISVQIPGEAGDALAFKAVQTYDNGEVVRWIGAPESDEPAPQVAVTASSEGHHGADAEAAPSDSEGASKGLGIAALILGALGLLAGGAALLRSRRAV